MSRKKNVQCLHIYIIIHVLFQHYCTLFNAPDCTLSVHYLTPFINEILKPLAKQSSNAQAKPSHVYITADTTAGAGLDETVNYWGDAN